MYDYDYEHRHYDIESDCGARWHSSHWRVLRYCVGVGHGVKLGRQLSTQPMYGTIHNSASRTVEPMCNVLTGCHTL